MGITGSVATLTAVTGAMAIKGATSRLTGTAGVIASHAAWALTASVATWMIADYLGNARTH